MWPQMTEKRRALLADLAARCSPMPAAVDRAELARLPAPVRRYLERVLPPQPRRIRTVTARQQGTFSFNGKLWLPFASRQWVTPEVPGFLWDASIQMMPFVNAFVHDAYLAGEGILEARLFGLIPLARQKPSPELAQGELLRFLAETLWYPTALIPGCGVKWTEVDDSTAQVSLQDRSTEASLKFHFGSDGLVDTVHADARPRLVKGKSIPAPWHCRFWDYRERQGLLVPLEGEVTWILPEGPLPYWRGRLVEVVYDFR